MCGQVLVWSCSCTLQMLFLSHKYYFYSLLLLNINNCVYRVVVCTLLYFLAFIPMCVCVFTTDLYCCVLTLAWIHRRLACPVWPSGCRIRVGTRCVHARQRRVLAWHHNRPSLAHWPSYGVASILIIVHDLRERKYWCMNLLIICIGISFFEVLDFVFLF